MKIDFRFSEDGDLMLGSPRLNEEGELLYWGGPDGITTDSTEGPLIRDISLAVSHFAEKQVIINRLKTDNPDWYHNQSIGANLSDLVGMPNTRETGEYGIELIKNSLCGDGYIMEGELSVRPVPFDANTILFHIQITRSHLDLVIPIAYDLETGLINVYEVDN